MSVGVAGSSNVGGGGGGGSVEWIELGGGRRRAPPGEPRRTAAGVQALSELTPEHAVDDEVDRRVGRHEQIAHVIVVEVDLTHTHTGQLSLAAPRGRLIEYQLRLG